MKKAIFIHGAYGNPDENWFPWLRTELTKRGWRVISPQFPTPTGQSLENWKAVWREKIDGLGSSDIIVAHSIGCAFALRILKELSTPIDGVYLVSGFSKQLGIAEFDQLNASFLTAPFDWKDIQTKAKTFVSIHGTDDPYVPLQLGKDIATAVDGMFYAVKGGGHLNEKAGYDAFPELLLAIS